jgi:hypothetical protein
MLVLEILSDLGRVDEGMLEDIVDQRIPLPTEGMILPLHFTRNNRIEKSDQGQRDLVLGIEGTGIDLLVMNGSDSVLADKERGDRPRDPSEHGLRVGKDRDRAATFLDIFLGIIHGMEALFVQENERITLHPLKGKMHVDELPFLPLLLGKRRNNGNKRKNRENGQDNSSASAELLKGHCPLLLRV